MASVTRRYWIDLNDMRVSRSLADRSPVQSITFKRYDSARIGVQFHRDGVPELLASGTTITFGIKANNDFAGSYLASATSWTAATTTASTDQVDSDFYYSTVDLTGSGVTDLLGSNDRQAEAMCEWELDISGAGERISTSIIDVTLEADLNRGGEGTPSGGNPPWPSDVSQLIRYRNDITSGIGGTSADIDSLTTTSITDFPYTIAINNADNSDNLEFWTLSSGTSAEDYGNGIIRPDDYATTTNQKIWTRSALFPAVNDEDVSAAASMTNYSPASGNAEAHFTAIDSALGTLGDVVSDTTPQLGGDLDTNSFNVDFDDAHGLRDDSGNEVLIVDKASSAVNYVEVGNAATGTGPDLTAAGDDTNIDLLLASKGSGTIKANGNQVLDTSDTTRAVLAGQSGGQTLQGDTAASGQLTLESTSNATKGGVAIADDDWLQFDEIGAPGTPASGKAYLYATTSGLLYKDDTGTATNLTTGSAARYKTVQLPLNDFTPDTGSATLSELNPAGGRDVLVWLFDDTATENINILWRIPEDMDVTADVKLKFCWSTSHTNTGNVYWLTQTYGSGVSNGADGEAISSSANVNEYTTDAAAGTAHVMNEPNAITILSGSTSAVGDRIIIAMARVGGDAADTMTGDAGLVGVYVQYKVSNDNSGW